MSQEIFKSPKAVDTETTDRPVQGREQHLLDRAWRFALGHPAETPKDYHHGELYFSYWAKAGNGDGAAAAAFDDRGWRELDLPHDWAVELPFTPEGSHSHGYHQLGSKFPDTSVGWYRKRFAVPAEDLGRRISLRFDGVFRNWQVWVNGFYLGHEFSGYRTVEYDITEYLNFGGDNTIAVRIDSRMEEGWFYEGAGIYRHVWLIKSEPVHQVWDGVAITTETRGANALVNVTCEVTNKHRTAKKVHQTWAVVDPQGKEVAWAKSKPQVIDGTRTIEFSAVLKVPRAQLWDIDTPHLYQLVSRVEADGVVIDTLTTTFGIRTVEFCPDRGFLLNGRKVIMTGTNNHQDHAGVGVAMPDALQDFRIQRLKDMGSNAYRCSHNPPTKELLDACDRLGMLVIDENRLMGTTDFMKDQTRYMIRRDRNHPSVVIWSLGNEEWAIEGNDKGARIASVMEAYARTLDPSRRFTVAISGGWGWGISTVIDVMGYNYISHGSTDDQHRQFPWQPGIGTEETTTQMTRGIYVDQKDKGWMAPLDNGTSGGNSVIGWKHYAQRDFLAGLFYWTGFDYRGEPVPFEWPAVSSQFGILDTCGFEKDWFWYLKSWWGKEPVLHVLPHWNWPGDEGKTKKVVVHSNCARVELFLNGKSLGSKDMPANDELVWEVAYQPGILEARGSGGVGGSLVYKVETTGASAALALEAGRTSIKADGEDISVVTVRALDSAGRFQPVAMDKVTFSLEGPGRIIGVGNGDPSSHENDVFVPVNEVVAGTGWRQKDLDAAAFAAGAAGLPKAGDSASRGAIGDGTWHKGFTNWTWGTAADQIADLPPAREYRVDFDLTKDRHGASVSLFVRTWGEETAIWLDGKELASGLAKNDQGMEITLDPALLGKGSHTLVMRAKGLGDKMARFPDIFDPAYLCFRTPAAAWERKLFNGLAQVIVQGDAKASLRGGKLVLRAEAVGLKAAELKIELEPARVRKVL